MVRLLFDWDEETCFSILVRNTFLAPTCWHALSYCPPRWNWVENVGISGDVYLLRLIHRYYYGINLDPFWRYAAEYGHVGLAIFLLSRTGDGSLHHVSSAWEYGHQNICNLILDNYVDITPYSDLFTDLVLKGYWHSTFDSSDVLCHLHYKQAVALIPTLLADTELDAEKELIATIMTFYGM